MKDLSPSVGSNRLSPVEHFTVNTAGVSWSHPSVTAGDLPLSNSSS